MITIDGRLQIKRYQAGLVPSIARSIAVGIGNTAETNTSTRLQFEVGRENVLVTSFDFINNRLIFKAPLPTDLGGTIYEVGIFSESANSVAGDYGSRLLASFDSDTETWTSITNSAPSTFVAAGRIGTDSMTQAPSASGNVTDALQEIFLDLSGYSASDLFSFAFNVNNANTSSIRYRFMTDSSNYYDITLGSQTSGYKIVQAAKSTAVATGTPSWENITEIRITTFATAGGAASVEFDGIRIEDIDTINPDYVLVAREVLSTPFVKQEGKTQEVEYSLDVTVA